MNLEMVQFYCSVVIMKYVLTLALVLALFTFFVGGSSTTPTRNELHKKQPLKIPLQNNISKFLPLYLKNRLKRQLAGVFHAKPEKPEKRFKILKMRKRRPKLGQLNETNNDLNLESGRQQFGDRPQRNFTAVEIVVKKRVDFNSEGPLPFENVSNVEKGWKFGQRPPFSGLRPQNVDAKLSGTELKPFVKYRSGGGEKQNPNPTESILPKQISKPNPINIQSTEPIPLPKSKINPFEKFLQKFGTQKPLYNPKSNPISIASTEPLPIPKPKPNLFHNFIHNFPKTQKPTFFPPAPTLGTTLPPKVTPKVNPFRNLNHPRKRIVEQQINQIPQEQISDGGELNEADLRDYLEGHQVFGARGEAKIVVNKIKDSNFKQDFIGKEINNNLKQTKSSNIPRKRENKKFRQIQNPTHPPPNLKQRINPQREIKETQTQPKELQENLIYTANSHPTTPTQPIKPTTFEYTSNEEKSTQFPQLTKSALDELFKAGHPAVARAPESDRNPENSNSKQPEASEPPEKFDPESDRFYGSPRLAENNDHNFERVYEPVEYADRRNDDDSFLKDFVSLDDNFERLPKAEKDDEELFGGREYNYNDNDNERPISEEDRDRDIDREEEDSGTRKTKENRDEYSPENDEGYEGPPIEADFDQSYIDALKSFDEELKKIQKGEVENNNNQALVISSPGPVVSYQRPSPTTQTTEEEEKPAEREEEEEEEEERPQKEEEEKGEEERPKEESKESEEESEERNPKEESKDESVKIKKILRVKSEGDNSKNGNLDEDISDIEREFAASGRI